MISPNLKTIYKLKENIYKRKMYVYQYQMQ